MFGYVRPEKPDLLMRDFAAYKAVYCGLCKTIGSSCGQIPRLAVTYDMTFLSILLLALSPDSLEINQEGCILNPLKKKPVMVTEPVLEYAADLSCIFAWYSARDDARDEKPVRGRIQAALFSRSARKAIRRRPQISQKIEKDLLNLARLEKEPDPNLAADCFGSILKEVFLEGFDLVTRDREDREVTRLLLGDAAWALGRWVYLVDAADDLEEDRKKGSPNPLAALADQEGRDLAEKLLIQAEEAVDRNLALLAYEQLSGLVYNIVTIGLPATRQRVLAGQPLPAL